ncbi:hypothetical protein OHU45_24535 [Streptomyces tubercidicus]|uniref:hypothetical protein n=1 Tax=Streptomyces tubercidicus TaxID=47759 RepID=UPI002E18A1B8|nr:GntR family transcriptional regulator [Streptomyces tubercidicus]
MGSSMSAAADRHTANALILFGSRSTTGPAAPVETATDEIRGQIVNGSWPVGSRIPPESALSETLGGSRARDPQTAVDAAVGLLAGHVRDLAVPVDD